jgi:GNAT superfamily N-acetyltransferase
MRDLVLQLFHLHRLSRHLPGRSLCHGIYLEDLYVEPEHRGGGIGKALLAALAKRCLDEGLTRLEWSVLDWNEPSIGFYRSLGAVPMDDWVRYRLAGEALARIGAKP